ncbi:IS200/IS605 family transposase [Candidiatus Paracoxiella cheracis]|uniref:IS200/IS605 family transposase n=1 Tax=Candidiatus Paracoxiella cheracis TaxID=3405120 RepID=UPI003BF5DA0F
MKLRKQSHCVYCCEYHLVLSTKYRRKIFNEGIYAYMVENLKELTDHYPEIDVLEINQDVDHIHLLLSIPPKMSVGKVVGIIKANTSRRLKAKFPFLKEVYWGTDGIWSDGYFVSTVGINEQIIQKYIQHQRREDSGQAQLVLDL